MHGQQHIKIWVWVMRTWILVCKSSIFIYNPEGILECISSPVNLPEVLKIFSMRSGRDCTCFMIVCQIFRYAGSVAATHDALPAEEFLPWAGNMLLSVAMCWNPEDDNPYTVVQVQHLLMQDPPYGCLHNM